MRPCRRRIHAARRRQLPLARLIQRARRPPREHEYARFTEFQKRKLGVKPGITCLWQVGEREGGLLEIGDRNSIDFPEQVSLDVRYIESQSFWKDVVILMKTVPAILFGKGM